MSSGLAKNKKKRANPKKYNLDYVTPWLDYEPIPEEPEPLPSHRNQIITKFFNQTHQHRKVRPKNQKVLNLSQFIKRRNTKQLTSKTACMHKTKKAKTEGDDQDGKNMEDRLLHEKQFFKKLEGKDKAVSIVDLNMTSQYFEEWELLYSRKKEQGAYQAEDPMQRPQYFRKPKLNMLTTQSKKFVIHKTPKTDNKSSKSYSKTLETIERRKNRLKTYY